MNEGVLGSLGVSRGSSGACGSRSNHGNVTSPERKIAHSDTRRKLKSAFGKAISIYGNSSDQ